MTKESTSLRHHEVSRRPGVIHPLQISCNLVWGIFYWVAVKELTFSYYIGETLLFTMYTHYGNLI